jgi:insulinase (Peptidase family M16)
MGIQRRMEAARRHARLAALVSLWAVLWSTRTQAETSVDCEQYRLPNGLNVILSRDTRTSNVAVNLSFRVGAADETPGHTGYAHIFEHMWFQGSAHISKALTDKLMTSIGADEDGTTEFDRTPSAASNVADGRHRIESPNARSHEPELVVRLDSANKMPAAPINRPGPLKHVASFGVLVAAKPSRSR